MTPLNPPRPCHDLQEAAQPTLSPGLPVGGDDTARSETADDIPRAARAPSSKKNAAQKARRQLKSTDSVSVSNSLSSVDVVKLLSSRSEAVITTDDVSSSLVNQKQTVCHDPAQATSRRLKKRARTESDDNSPVPTKRHLSSDVELKTDESRACIVDYMQKRDNIFDELSKELPEVPDSLCTQPVSCSEPSWPNVKPKEEKEEEEPVCMVDFSPPLDAEPECSELPTLERMTISPFSEQQQEDAERKSAFIATSPPVLTAIDTLADRGCWVEVRDDDIELPTTEVMQELREEDDAEEKDGKCHDRSHTSETSNRVQEYRGHEVIDLQDDVIFTKNCKCFICLNNQS